jgi:hypothetical protein
VPAFVEPEAAVSIDETGLFAEATLVMASLDNLATAAIGYGVQLDDGSAVFFGDEPATIADDGSGVVSGFYDLTVLNISDGIDTATAYISLTIDDASDGYGLDVPMAYYPPGWVDGDPYEDVVLNIAVDGAGDVIAETYYSVDPETGATGELYADPEGIIVPQVLVVGADGELTWQPTSDVGLYANLPDLTYTFEPWESGTPLLVSLTVTDFGGNTATVSGRIDLP